MEVVVTTLHQFTLHQFTLHQFLRKRFTFSQFTSNLSYTLNRFIKNRFILSHIMVQVVQPVDSGAEEAALSLTARVRLLVPATAMVTGEYIPYTRN
jgi:hypothetical protein